MKTFYHKFTTEPFAMLPSAAAEWAAKFEYAAPSGAQQDDDRDFLGNTKPKMSWVGSVAIVPVCGPLIKGAGFLEKGFGAMAHSDISDNIAQALAANCTGIVLLVDSPGGTVRGTSELADEIYQARQKTNVVAFTDGMAASAAYWLASSASAVYASPSAEVGAIGAILQTASISRLLTSAGVDVATFVSKGSDNKAAGNPYKAMSDGERAQLQAGVDKAGAMFTAAVARNRPKYGGTQDGAMLFASDAKAAGLIDAVVPNLNAVVSMVQSSNPYYDPASDGGLPRDNNAKPRSSADRYEQAGARAMARGQAFIAERKPTQSHATPAASDSIEAQWAKLSASGKADFGSIKRFSAFIRNGGERAIYGGGGSQRFTAANFKNKI